MDIHSQTKSTIYNVYTYFKTLAKCKDKPELADYFRQAQERTAEACAVSLSTVQRICKESKITVNQEESLCVGSSDDLKFKSPRKTYCRKKHVTELDDFDSEVVRRVVQSFYDRGEFPSSAKILVELREKINYRGSKSSVKIILKQLNLSSNKYKKCNVGREFLTERSGIVAAKNSASKIEDVETFVHKEVDAVTPDDSAKCEEHCVEIEEEDCQGGLSYEEIFEPIILINPEASGSSEDEDDNED